MSSSEDIPASLKTQAAADWIRKMGEEAATSALADMAVVQEARAKAAVNVGAYAEPDHAGNTDTVMGADYAMDLDLSQYKDDDDDDDDFDDAESWMGGGGSQTVSDAMLVVGCCTIITAVVSAIFP